MAKKFFPPILFLAALLAALQLACEQGANVADDEDLVAAATLHAVPVATHENDEGLAVLPPPALALKVSPVLVTFLPLARGHSGLHSRVLSRIHSPRAPPERA